MKYPSKIAAVFVGAVLTPIFILITQAFEKHYGNVTYFDFALFLWSIIGFLFPFAISTIDFKYSKRVYGSYWGILRLKLTKKDLMLDLIPTWIRMLFWFFSAAISSFLLVYMGIMK